MQEDVFDPDHEGPHAITPLWWLVCGVLIALGLSVFCFVGGSLGGVMLTVSGWLLGVLMVCAAIVTLRSPYAIKLNDTGIALYRMFGQPLYIEYEEIISTSLSTGRHGKWKVSVVCMGGREIEVFNYLTKPHVRSTIIERLSLRCVNLMNKSAFFVSLH